MCDEVLRFYWTSVIDARHSKNVRANGRVALSIYDSTYIAMSGQPTALYGEGLAQELDRAEVEALRPSIDRWISWRDAGRKAPRTSRQERSDDSPWRIYRVNPARLYALHPDGHPEHGKHANWRMAVDLKDSFAQAYRSRSG